MALIWLAYHHTFLFIVALPPICHVRRADFVEEQQEAQQPLGYFAKLEKVRSKR